MLNSFPNRQVCTLILFLLVTGAMVCGQAYGQTGDVPALPTPANYLPDAQSGNLNINLPAVPQSYRIGSDDLLYISVLRMPDLDGQVRVADDGTIQLPLLNRPVVASGLTATELQKELEATLTRRRLAVDPTVQVVVRQVLSHPIVVAGAVKNPMVLQASRPMRLLEVLARAGGLSTSAGTTVLLSQPAGTGTITRTIDVATLTETTSAAEDPLLHGNDVVRVLPARRVFVVGALLKPGAFPVLPGQPVTVLEALALAEGFSPSNPADKKHSFIIRTRDGQQKQIPINIDAMLKHQQPDPVLEAGDVLYVPENNRHKAIMTALGTATQIVVLGVGYNAARIF